MTGPAGRLCSGPHDCKDAGWDPGPLPILTDWPAQAVAALWECKHHKLRQGILYIKNSSKRIPGGSTSIGLAGHASGDCSERMPWWGQSLRPWKNAWHDAQPFHLAWNGYTGKGIHQEVPSVCHLQGKATQGPHGKYHGYPSPGAGAQQLPVPGAREG